MVPVSKGVIAGKRVPVGGLWGRRKTSVLGARTETGLAGRLVHPGLRLAGLFLIAHLCFAVTPVLIHSNSSENSRGNYGYGGNTLFVIPNVDPAIGGNCLGVAFEWSTIYSQPSGITVSDDKSDTYYQISQNPNDAANGRKMQVWIAPNVAAGAHLISIAFGVQTTYIQAIAFEVANCASTPSAIDDGASSNVGSGAAVTAGALTPGTSGDLLLHFAFVTGTTNVPAASGVTLFSQSNIAWQLEKAELLDGTLMQSGAYNSTIAINPEMTIAPASGFISIAVAIKGGSGGGTPSGMTVNRISHVSMWSTATGGPGYPSPSITQFPATGNLLLASVGAGCDIKGISYGSTPMTKRLSYVGAGASETEQVFELANYSPNNTNTIAITPDLACTAMGFDYDFTVVFYDVSNAAASPYDTSSTSSGDVTSCSPPCNLTGPTITPGDSNGLVLAIATEWYDAVNGIQSPFNLDTINQSPLYQSPGIDQENGWAHFYNSSATPVAPTWTFLTVQVEGYWASVAISYKAAAAGSFLPPTNLTVTVH
jgi:hypothetical protein